MLAILLSRLPAAVRAEEPPRVRLEDVVVTGTKTEEEAWESTVPTQVVPREQIEDKTTIDVENALTDIPGLYLKKNEQFALGASTVRMQGLDPNKVAILIDGRRFRGGIDGVVDLRDIPANNIQRVEVIRGPASSLYGSDAMAGVINLITRSGGPTPVTELTAAQGSFGRQYYAGAHGWQYGPVRWFVSGSHDEFRLFDQFGAISRQFSGDNEDEKQYRDQGSIRLDVDVAPHHALTLTPSFQQQTNTTSTNRNLVTSGEWRWDTTPGSRLTTWVNRYGFDRENDLSGFEEKSDYVDWEGESRWGVELGRQPWWASHRVTVGLRGRTQSLKQDPISVTAGRNQLVRPGVESSIWQVSPFLQSDLLFGERWSLVVGSSFDVNEFSGVDVNPRATATWRPTDISRFSFTVGEGFRAPDLIQLSTIDINDSGTYALLGNEDLQPEKDLAFELEAGLRMRGVDGHLALFRHQLRDLIAFEQVAICTSPGVPDGCIEDPLPGLPSTLRFQTRNLARALSQGIELGIDVMPLDLLLDQPVPHRLTVGLGFSLLDTENQNGIAGEDGNDLPFSPRYRVLPEVTYRHAGLGLLLGVWGEYEDDAFTDVANSPALLARNHWLWNFKAGVYPLRIVPDSYSSTWLDVGRHVQLFVQGENVFDQEFGPIAGVGRLAGPAAYLFGIAATF